MGCGVIQLDSPRTVASFLQRLGRTGRRPSTDRNTLLLATSGEALVQAGGLLKLWGEGWVEPVTPPASPRHLVAQQLLGLCLQEHRVGDATWPEWLPALAGIPAGERRAIVDWLVDTGHLDHDQGMLFIGPEAERRYGRRHFMDLVSVFTADPEFTVIAGRAPLGTIDPLVLTRRIDGPRVIMLAARAWRVTHVDWKRRRCWVEPTDRGSRMRWQSQPQPLSFAVCQSRRDVLLGDDSPVTLTRRATAALERERRAAGHSVARAATVVDTDTGWWWTWAGARGNATLAAALSDIVDQRSRYENDRLRLRGDIGPTELGDAIAGVDPGALPLPQVDAAAIRGLKFGESLPPGLAVRTLAERLADADAAATVLATERITIKGA